jgi:hypothetical protein
MDATCRFCGNPAEVVTTDGDSTCGACSKRAERRRLIFDVSEGAAPPRDKEHSAPSSPPEETRMHDLRDLAMRTRASLATARRADDLDVPLDVREAILLIDSIAPASIDPARAAVDPSPPSSPPSSPVPTTSRPATRRLRAVYSGVGLLVIMAGLVVAKAQVGREVASAAGLAPEQVETTALLPATAQAPSTEAPLIAARPTAAPSVTAAPTAPPQKTKARPAPPRPKAPTPAETPEIRAAAEPTAAPRVDLLDAMQAAVAAHSAPAAAPKVNCTPGAPSGSGCPRAATGASSNPP